MNNMKKVGILLLAICLLPAFSQAASSKPDAILRLTGGSVAAGIGYSWEKGTLTYKGKDYPVSLKGLSLVKVGITKVTATGKVYNLKSLRDFDGNYTAAGAGMTLAGGGTVVTMKNQNNVKVELSSTNKGVDFSLGGGGVSMNIKK
jgi:hypothetical protein